MIQTVTDFATAHYGSNFTLACGASMTLPVIEMSTRVFVDLYLMWKHVEDHDKISLYSSRFTKDLGFSIVYGLLASNMIPGAAVVGAGAFLGHSFWEYHSNRNECYLTSKALIRSIEFVVMDILKPLIQPAVEFLFKKIIQPIFDFVIYPVCKKIHDVMSTIFSQIGNFFAKIPFKSHPIWIGVVLLTAATITYKLAVPLLFH